MSSEETRPAIRVGHRLAIEYSSNCPPIQAFVEDLSETGMYIDVYQATPVGNTLEFSLSLPDLEADTPVKGSAVVVWSGPTGMGVKFTELSDAARERIRFFVAAVHFDQPPDLPAS
jgi:c-di-GMP-binding flagellar brake protein YcgR